MTFIITTSSIAEASITEVGLPVVTLGLAVPAPPTSLAATADGTNPQYVDLAWTASASAPVTGYKVFRALGGSGSYSQIGTTASTSYDDDTTAASTEYDYYVVAYNNAGDSAASNVDTITTGSAIAAPANLAVTLVNDTGVLTWDAVSGADGYKVERTLTGAGSWSEIDDVATNTATDTYSAVDTGYDYRVRAYIGGTFGEYSSTVSGVYSPILYDDCVGSDNATIAARSPTLGSGTWSAVASGSLAIVTKTGGKFGLTGSTGSPYGYYTCAITGTLEADVTLGSRTGVVFRYVDSSNHLMVDFNTTDLFIRIRRTVGGASTLNSVSHSFTDGVEYRLRVEFNASTGDISATIDGITLTASNTEYAAATAAGVAPFASNAGQRWDNVTFWRAQ